MGMFTFISLLLISWSRSCSSVELDDTTAVVQASARALDLHGLDFEGNQSSVRNRKMDSSRRRATCTDLAGGLSDCQLELISPDQGCSGTESNLGSVADHNDCAKKCKAKYGDDCNFFMIARNKASCWWQSDAACTNKYRDMNGNYDLWRIAKTKLPKPQKSFEMVRNDAACTGAEEKVATVATVEDAVKKCIATSDDCNHFIFSKGASHSVWWQHDAACAAGIRGMSGNYALYATTEKTVPAADAEVQFYHIGQGKCSETNRWTTDSDSSIKFHEDCLAACESEGECNAYQWYDAGQDCDGIDDTTDCRACVLHAPSSSGAPAGKSWTFAAGSGTSVEPADGTLKYNCYLRTPRPTPAPTPLPTPFPTPFPTPAPTPPTPAPTPPLPPIEVLVGTEGLKGEFSLMVDSAADFANSAPAIEGARKGLASLAGVSSNQIIITKVKVGSGPWVDLEVGTILRTLRASLHAGHGSTQEIISFVYVVLTDSPEEAKQVGDKLNSVPDTEFSEKLIEEIFKADAGASVSGVMKEVVEAVDATQMAKHNPDWIPDESDGALDGKSADGAEVEEKKNKKKKNKAKKAASCFPGDAFVHVHERGDVRASELQVGERVLVKPGVFEPVLGLVHELRSQPSEFLTVGHSLGEFSATANHIIFANEVDMLVANVQIGDHLFVGDAKSVVLSVKRSIGTYGMFAPLTPSGTIVVDDVLASTYAGSSETMSAPHVAAHTIAFPARMYHVLQQALTYLHQQPQKAHVKEYHPYLRALCGPLGDLQSRLLA